MKKSFLVTGLVAVLMLTMCFSMTAAAAEPACSMESIVAEGLDIAVKFAAEEDAGEYADWNADFAISCNEGIAESAVVLKGQYDANGADWVELPAFAVEANETINLLEVLGSAVTYEEVVTLVKEFKCGIEIVDPALANATFTLALNLDKDGEIKNVVTETFKAEVPNCTIDAIEKDGLDFAVAFKAVAEDAGVYADWNADFVISADKDIAAGDVTLAGSYAAYNDGEWVSFEVPAIAAGTEVKLVEALGKTVTYEEVLTLVKEFKCGVATDLEDVTFTLALNLYNGDEVVTVVENEYKVNAGLPAYDSEVLKYGEAVAKTVLGDIVLDMAMKFTALEEVANPAYADWNADFVLTCDKDIDTSKGFALAGYYDYYSVEKYGEEGHWEAFIPQAYTAGDEIRAVDACGFTVKGIKYSEVVDYVKEFTCGIYAAPELDEALQGAKFTLSLNLYERDENGNENGNVVTVATNEFIYDKWAEAADAGEGKMRFLFNADVDTATAQKVGIIFFKGAEMVNVTVDDADITITDLTTSAFHIDIAGLTEAHVGNAYSAIAYISASETVPVFGAVEGVIWSDVVTCVPTEADLIAE